MYGKRKAMRKHKSISAIRHVERNVSNFLRSRSGEWVINTYAMSVKACESFFLRDKFLLKDKAVYLFIPVGFPCVQIGYRGSREDLTESIAQDLVNFGIAASLKLKDVLREKRKKAWY